MAGVCSKREQPLESLKCSEAPVQKAPPSRNIRNSFANLKGIIGARPEVSDHSAKAAKLFARTSADNAICDSLLRWLLVLDGRTGRDRAAELAAVHRVVHARKRRAAPLCAAPATLRRCSAAGPHSNYQTVHSSAAAA